MSVTAAEIKDAMRRYTELITAGDLEGIVQLYAEDATVEDPVGSDPHVGHDAIREFYKKAEGIEMVLDGAVRVAGNNGAAGMIAKMREMKLAIETLDIMVFNDAGKITSMKAYWGDTNMRPLMENE